MFNSNSMVSIKVDPGLGILDSSTRIHNWTLKIYSDLPNKQRYSFVIHNNSLLHFELVGLNSLKKL